MTLDLSLSGAVWISSETLCVPCPHQGLHPGADGASDAPESPEDDIKEAAAEETSRSTKYMQIYIYL